MRLVRNLAVLLLFLLATAGLRTGVVWADDAIGYVKSAEGTTLVVREEESAPIAVGDPVFVADLLIVKGNGSMGITFIDNSQLSMGSGSQLRLTSFEFVPKEEKLSFVTELLKGTLLYVSGVIAKLSPDSVSVVTPVATLSVRGTKFLARVDD
ncbi:FecR domain-containing protein [Pelagibius sp. Alg239-R121]|uniref:FecR family protein n=1 Tax=Pelagibius sp. Alg239-R121 TaxID=2993448 RepID=UPI0024A68225|nr:FecR domain-containing protein [Pelagibius sp. Alg239-R121]